MGVANGHPMVATMMNLKTTLKALLICSILCGSSGRLMAAQPVLDVAYDLSYSENLSKTTDSSGPAIDGLSSLLSISGKKSFVLSDKSSFIFKLGADLKKQHIDENADYGEASLTMVYGFQPLSGFGAPKVRLSLDVSERFYSGDFDTTETVRLGISASKQWSDAVKTQVGLARILTNNEYPPVQTSNIRSWDTEFTQAFASIDYQTEWSTIYGKLTYNRGAYVWTDNSTGGLPLGRLVPDSDIYLLDLGLSVPLSQSAALDVLARRVESRHFGREVYDLNSVSIAYLHRLPF